MIWGFEPLVLVEGKWELKPPIQANPGSIEWRFGNPSHIQQEMVASWLGGSTTTGCLAPVFIAYVSAKSGFDTAAEADAFCLFSFPPIGHPIEPNIHGTMARSGFQSGICFRQRVFSWLNRMGYCKLNSIPSPFLGSIVFSWEGASGVKHPVCTNIL